MDAVMGWGNRNEVCGGLAWFSGISSCAWMTLGNAELAVLIGVVALVEL